MSSVTKCPRCNLELVTPGILRCTICHQLQIDDEGKLSDYLKSLDDKEGGFFFNKALEELWKTANISKQELIDQAFLNASYVFDLFAGRKLPSRDTVFKLALALQSTIPEANTLLQQAGLACIYPAIPREAIIKFALAKKMSPQQTNHLLYDNDQELLYKI